MDGKDEIQPPLQQQQSNPNPDPSAAPPPPQTPLLDSSSRPPSPPAGQVKLYAKVYPNTKGRTTKTHASGRRRAVEKQVNEVVDESGVVEAVEKQPLEEVDTKKTRKAEKTKGKSAKIKEKTEKSKAKRQSKKNAEVVGKEPEAEPEKVNENVSEVVGGEGDKPFGVQVAEQVAKALDDKLCGVVCEQVGEEGDKSKAVGEEGGGVIGEQAIEACCEQVVEEGDKSTGVQVGYGVAKAVGEEGVRVIGEQVGEIVGELGVGDGEKVGRNVKHNEPEVIVQHNEPEVIVQQVLEEPEVVEQDNADVVIEDAKVQDHATEVVQNEKEVGSSTERWLAAVDNYHEESSTAAGGVNVGESGNGDKEVDTTDRERAENVDGDNVGESGNGDKEVDTTDRGRAENVDGDNVGEGDGSHGTEQDEEGVGIRVDSEVEEDGMYVSYKHHAAYKAFEHHKDRGVTTCKTVGAFYEAWDLSQESKEVQKLVKGAPFYDACVKSYTTHNRIVISALIERWHPETNTFHLPKGELTITLDDILEILGIPVVGKPMVGDLPSEHEQLVEYVSELLGVCIEEVEAQMKLNSGKRLRFDWLKLFLKKREGEEIAGTDKKVTAEQVARGYLLTLLGSTIFCDKTGVMVSMKYLLYLEDLTKLGDWSWGSATLARLYHYLGSASRWGSKQVGGYLTLLEAWAYEHIPILRPKVFTALEPGVHRLEQWVPKSSFYKEDEDDILFAKRCQLNSLDIDVIWMPYRKVPFKPHEIVWFTGVIADDFFTEAYNPERVMRQFGYVQTKPSRPYVPKVCERNFNPRKYLVEYSHIREYFVRFESHVVCDVARGSQVSAANLNECTAEYTDWYKKSKGVLTIPRQPKTAPQAAGEETKLKEVLDYLANLKTKVMSITKIDMSVKIAEALALGGYVEKNDGAAQPRQRTRLREGAEQTEDVGRSQKKRKVQFAQDKDDDEEEVEETQLVRKKSGKESGKRKQAESRGRTKKK